MNKHDYTGKIVYVGIDVHKKTYHCVSVIEGQMIRSDSMPARAVNEHFFKERNNAIAQKSNFYNRP